MALNYWGINISVDTFIKKYLEKGDYNSFDPNICFGGDPRDLGMGCYARFNEGAEQNTRRQKLQGDKS